jgi:hypothetical protein
MRRALSTLAVTAAVLAWSAAPAAAQTLEISFRTALTKPHSTCDADATFCAPVTVPGFGAGTLTFMGDAFNVISRSCAEYTGIATVEFEDSSLEPLVMAESGTVCFPGNSFNAPRGLRSYGNPFTQTGTFVVESGAGLAGRAYRDVRRQLRGRRGAGGLQHRVARAL